LSVILCCDSLYVLGWNALFCAQVAPLERGHHSTESQHIGPGVEDKKQRRDLWISPMIAPQCNWNALQIAPGCYDSKGSSGRGESLSCVICDSACFFAS